MKNQLEKHKIDADSIRENHKEFKQTNKLILESRKRFRSENYNLLSE